MRLIQKIRRHRVAVVGAGAALVASFVFPQDTEIRAIIVVVLVAIAIYWD